MGARSMSVVEVTYAELCDTRLDLSAKIQQAYGRDGLGILTVSGVPGYSQLRQQLLPLAENFSRLPASVHAKYEDAESLYNNGWSHGKEAMHSGMPDTHKGSYYANPVSDEPIADEALRRRYPTYGNRNCWPRAELPELETAFKALGRLLVDLGLMVAERCDRYVEEQSDHQEPGVLCRMICHSTTKGRLLHYFPPQLHTSSSTGSNSSSASCSDSPDDWCGWHTDHGLLTGLTSAMYLSDGAPVACPDPTAGLYIRARCGTTVRAALPPDHVAFQLGEAAQICTGGALRATPHCVRAPAEGTAVGVSRNTLAVFMNPALGQVLEAPTGCSHRDVAVARWHPGLSFGNFSDRTFQRYYTDFAPSKPSTPPHPSRRQHHPSSPLIAHNQPWLGSPLRADRGCPTPIQQQAC